MNAAPAECAACGGDATGSGHAIHRDGFLDGPEVPICRACGAGKRPTCEELWEAIAARNAVADARSVAPVTTLAGTAGDADTREEVRPDAAAREAPEGDEGGAAGAVAPAPSAQPDEDDACQGTLAGEGSVRGRQAGASPPAVATRAVSYIDALDALNDFARAPGEARRVLERFIRQWSGVTQAEVRRLRAGEVLIEHLRRDGESYVAMCERVGREHGRRVPWSAMSGPEQLEAFEAAPHLAGPWKLDRGEIWERSVRGLVVAVVSRESGGTWYYDVSCARSIADGALEAGDDSRGDFATADQARDAADGAMRSTGWVLVDETTGAAS